MSEAQVLYKLQTIDLSIEENERLYQEIESKLGETEELIDARKRLRDVETRLSQTQKALHDAEDEIEDLSAKIQPMEAKLYGGTVKNPKELSALQQEVEAYKHKKSGIEDNVLEFMTEIEELQAKVNDVRADTMAVEEQWQSDQEALRKEREVIEAQLTDLRAEREAVAATITPASIHIYEGLRRTKKGKAVAKVEQNTCQGCRVSLPMNEVQRARASKQLAFCSTCGRIIWVTR